MAGYVVLFGAGASYGSDDCGTPPLGDALFEALGRYNPDGWGRLEGDLREAFLRDFEAGMVNLSANNAHALPPLQRAMAAYFFEFVPRESSLYLALADRIASRAWRGMLATLNYERLLEIALSHRGVRPVVNMEPRTDAEVELCLPHGCCHLFCESVHGAAAAVSFAGPNVQTNGPVVAVGNSVDFRRRIVSDAFPPVMSYFDPQKRTTSGANFIETQRARWTEAALDAEVIGIVGVRVRPDDTHIWEPLANSPGKLVYCSGGTATDEFEQWAAESRLDVQDLVIREYFADAFEELCVELGLG